MKIIRVDQDSYFCDKYSGEPITKFDPSNENLEFRYVLGGNIIHVPQQNIKCGKPLGIYFTDPRGDTVAIDDGYQQELVYSGYIINGIFDTMQERDQKRGIKTRRDIHELLIKAIHKFINNSNGDITLNDTVEKINNNIICRFKTSDGITGDIEFKTISNIVNQNKFRREYSLQYYPYIKNIDKYNSYYIDIFVNNKGTSWNGNTVIFDKFLDSIIANLNQCHGNYKFHSRVMSIRQRTIRWNIYNFTEENKPLANLSK